ncbi:MAG TPA: hypothetical protein VIF40_03660 [Methylosinus sp.]|jgi:hypothetical protein|uniref:hypothetical protein n=1 Tax=Methylosinus sp. TaxID=427 RepID=UPI002F93D0D4
MQNNHSLSRREHFEQNYLPWISLRHFLSADMLEELCAATVEIVSDNQVALSDLFDMLSSGEGVLAAWIIRPRKIQDPFAAYLQNLIRSVVSNNDSVVRYPRGVASSKSSVMEALETAYALGSIDIDTLTRWRPDAPIPEALTVITDAIGKLHERGLSPEALASLVENITSAFSRPLDAVVVKHLGDLCGDIDCWDAAKELYKHAESMLSQDIGFEWRAFVASMRVLTTQSHATALWFAQGPQIAHDCLTKLTKNSNLNSEFLSISNASTDSMQSATEATDTLMIPDEIRPAILFAPQVKDTYNLGGALMAWACEDYVNANRKFWAILRRQISLGVVVESSRTKAFYGRSIIDELRSKIKNDRNEEAFSIGLRLIIESGFRDIAEKTTWSEEFVRCYVQLSSVQEAIDICKRTEGVKIKRTAVALVIFRRWLQFLPIESTDAASMMIRFIADATRFSERSIFSDRDLGNAGLKGLQEIAKSRPEFRGLEAESIIKAISTMVDDKDFNNISSAIETFSEYADIFSDELLSNAIKAMLSSLERFPNGAPWTVARVAITFLVSEPAISLYGRDREIAKIATQALIRYCLETESEHARILFIIHRLGSSLIELGFDKLEYIVSHTRARASEFNSSNATYYIMALLVEPKIVKEAGVRDAINALIAILKSAANGDPAISFSDAWHPLMILADKQRDMARELAIEEEKLADLIGAAFNELLSLWRMAATEPLIFCTFSFPPATTPNTTIIHNWAFASIAFARSLGREEELAQAMHDATRHPLLGSSIAIAKSFQLSSSDPELFNLELIHKENKESFYVSLGKRLALLKSLPPATGKAVVEVMLRQCFRFGPNGLDAGVFSTATSVGVEKLPISRESDAYRRRLENSRDLRLSLFPLFDELVSVEGHS